MNPSPSGKEPGDFEKRKEQRYSVATAATLTRLDPPFWQTNGTVANVSANGLLLTLPAESSLQIGARVKVRFGTTTVSGTVRHLTLNDDSLMVGVLIDEAKFD